MTNGYNLFSDPILLGLTVSIIFLFKIGCTICIKANTKIKLYDIQINRPGVCLDLANHYLKKQDLLQFGDLGVVKEYFIKKNKQWIVKNIFRIFDKADFQKNGGYLLQRYRHYLNIQKQRAQHKQLLASV